MPTACTTHQWVGDNGCPLCHPRIVVWLVATSTYSDGEEIESAHINYETAFAAAKKRAAIEGCKDADGDTWKGENISVYVKELRVQD